MQFELSEFTQKNVVILGKNKEADVFEEFLQKHASVNSILIIEDIKPDQIKQRLSSLNLEQSIIVKTSEVPSRFLASTPYTTPTNVFFRCIRSLRAYSVGVMGTWGKSTTTAMIGYMIHQAGLQALVSRDGDKLPIELLDEASEKSFFVIELSSQMLDGLTYTPTIAVLTGLYKEHIDYHGSLEAYWGVHQEILEKMSESQLFIYDSSNEIVLHWLAGKSVKSFAIDLNEQIDMSQSHLIGDFNKRNYQMARAAALSVGIDALTCQNALKSYQPLPHRMQRVRTVKGVTYIDDAESKSAKITNDEIMACVRQVGPVGCVMLGGDIQNKEEFETLLRTLSTLLVPKIILFPPLNEDTIKLVLSERYNPEVFVVDDMVKAVNWAASHTPSGSICLLSTAGDTKALWPHADEKGNQFHYAVNALSN